MSIVEKERKGGGNAYCYKSPDENTLYEMAGDFLETVKLYTDAISDLGYKELRCDYTALMESIVRVDKRKDYFMIFHNDTNVNENRVSALQAYWIIKFKPFSIHTASIARKYPHINELIATFLIISSVKETSCREISMEFLISPKYIFKLHYALRYWDLSKESLILVTETLSESMKHQ